MSITYYIATIGLNPLHLNVIIDVADESYNTTDPLRMINGSIRTLQNKPLIVVLLIIAYWKYRFRNYNKEDNIERLFIFLEKIKTLCVKYPLLFMKIQ